MGHNIGGDDLGLEDGGVGQPSEALNPLTGGVALLVVAHTDHSLRDNQSFNHQSIQEKWGGGGLSIIWLVV